MMDPSSSTRQADDEIPCDLLDGTGNQIKAKDNTNVVRLFSLLLELTDPERQVAKRRARRRCPPR
jgi:hypothetical protein